jgi:starch-binding outer membrane protein, SusD/RagB family
MKKYFFHIAASVMIISISCSKKLDEVNPDTQVRFESISDRDLPLIINGTYLALTSNNYNSYYYLHDLMSDDVETLPGSAFDGNTIPVTDNSASINYQYAYKAIANINILIQYAEGKTDADVQQYYGQGKFLRAYCYLRLVQHYGGVPIKLGNESVNDKPLRKTSEEVYDFIIADLKAAITILPDFATGALANFKPTRQAAQALLARVYLETGKNAEAKAEALNVINSGKFNLDNNFSNLFSYNSNSKENIYRIAENSTSASNPVNSGLAFNYGSGDLIGTPPVKIGSGNIWIDSNLVKSYEQSDKRRALYSSKINTNLNLLVYYATKFPAEVNHAYPVLRLSEMYLIVAEAGARMGTIDVSWYNTVRTSRNATTKMSTDFTNVQDFLNELENERRREFVGEALRWQDMRRFGKAIPYLQSKLRPAGNVLLPIPERELFLNPNMIQNKDY